MKKKPIVIDYHTKCPPNNKIENLEWVDRSKRITVENKTKNK